MKMDQPSRKRTMGLAASLVAATLVWAPVTAYAEISNVSGTDFWYDSAEGEGNYADLLTVEGTSKDDVVYLNIKADGQLIASHLEYQFDTDGEENYLGIVSLKLDEAIDPTQQTLTIDVFADRAEKTQKYSGTTTMVWAQLGNGGKIVPLALRTRSTDEQDRAFSAPQSLKRDSVEYKLSSNTPTTVEGVAGDVYLYEEADLNESVTGHVKYYNIADNSEIKSESFEIEKDGSKTIPIDTIIATDSGYYRTLQLTNAVSASYPGTTEFAIMCRKIDGSWGADAPYVAHIQYVDASKNVLASENENATNLNNLIDKLIVTKDYLYTPPTCIYIEKDGVVEAYELVTDASDEDLAKLEDGVLKLSPTDTDKTDLTYKIAYRKMDETSTAKWVVTCIDGSVPEGDSKRVISTKTYSIEPGESVTHEVEQEINGLVPMAIADATQALSTDDGSLPTSVKHTYDAARLVDNLTIYYAPKDYTEDTSYTVTVNYVNVANNQVISTKTATATPDLIVQRKNLQITTDATFTSGGTQYVRLNGQASDIQHNYYAYTVDGSGNRSKTYTVYYRDVNDDLNEATVITRVRTVYDGTTYVDNGVVRTVDRGTTTGTSTGTGASAGTTGSAALTNDGGLTAITNNDNGTSTLVRDDGSTVTGERIDDDANPLAAPDASGSAGEGNVSGAQAAASTAGMSASSIAAFVAGVIAAAAAVFFLLFKRRKDGEGDE